MYETSHFYIFSLTNKTTTASEKEGYCSYLRLESSFSSAFLPSLSKTRGIEFMGQTVKLGEGEIVLRERPLEEDRHILGASDCEGCQEIRYFGRVGQGKSKLATSNIKTRPSILRKHGWTMMMLTAF